MIASANILLFFLPPMLGFLYAIIGLLTAPSKWRKYIPFLVYFFFIGAYAFEPPAYTANFDLSRYLPDIEAFGKLSLSAAFQYFSDVLYARDIMFWVFGHLQLPHMVPALTTAVVYAVGFYITCDTAERYNATKYIGRIILLQIAMLPYINIVNNVRNVFGFSLIILAVYLDVVKEKRNFWVIFLYLFGTLMHLSAVIFIVFRLLCRPMKRAFGVVLVFPAVFSSLIVLLYNIRSVFNIGGSLGASINLAILKLYWYMTDTSSDYAVLSLNSVTVKFDRVVMILGMVVALVLVYYILNKKKPILVSNDSRMATFVGLTASLTLASNVFAMPNFWRFSAALYVMIAVLLIPYLSQRKFVPDHFQRLLWTYAFLGVVNLLMQFWKCTWFDFGEWIQSFFLTNVITIIIDMLKALVVG